MRALLLFYLLSGFILAAAEEPSISPYFLRHQDILLAIENYDKALDPDIDPVYALYLLDRGKNYTLHAKEVDAVLQRLEGETESSLVKSSDLTALIDRIDWRSTLIRSQVREFLQKKTGIEVKITALIKGIGQLQGVLEGIEANKGEAEKSSYINFMIYLADPLESLWKSVADIAHSAEKAYLLAIGSIKKGRIKEGVAELQESLDSLQKLIGKTINVEQELFVDYWLLVSDPSPSMVELLILVKKLKNVKHLSKNPQEELERTLFASQQALHLNLIAQMEKDKVDLKEIPLRVFEEDVLIAARDFVLFLLGWEKAQYKALHCQKRPWQRLIPLFQRGYEHGRAANKQLEENNFATAITNQERTVFYWTQALQSLESRDNLQEQNEVSGNLENSFQELQEMFLEDSKKKEPPNQGLRLW